MADDMGMGDTSAFQDFTGNSDDVQIHTPNMERLARMGIRFTDAHTPSSRCSPTRYGLLTGRYPWRNRLKHWVLFGVQGDPMIETGRPTLGTLFQDHGYRTGLVGKWHVGLRYRQSNGLPADQWEDADLTQPMIDTPLDHGFDFCRFTSRSHGTSGPTLDDKPAGKTNAGKTDAGKKVAEKKSDNPNRNGPKQSRGPGHIHGRTVVGATGNGKELQSSGPNAYVLKDLGGRHYRHAIEFLKQHIDTETDEQDRPQTSARQKAAHQPFFLYYPSNSNHGPYTPDDSIDGTPIAGAARTVSGQPMDARGDFIYENDVVLGKLIDFLQTNDDPRNPGHALIDNTIVIFTSDNGAEQKKKSATGPFRSNKGSCFEGGHRVPFIVTWKAGGIGDGNPDTNGQSSDTLIGLHDMFSTFAEVLGSSPPAAQQGMIGGEDSISVLDAWRGKSMPNRPMFYHDHNQAKDRAVAVLRLDDPTVEGRTATGQWKMFFDAKLLRRGIASPTALYDLAVDRMETTNLLDQADKSLVAHLVDTALLHRTVGGHRLAPFAAQSRVTLRWREQSIDEKIERDVRELFSDTSSLRLKINNLDAPVNVTVAATRAGKPAGNFSVNSRGLGIEGGKFKQVDDGERLEIRFDQDVLIESVGIVAGNGVCGGTYTAGDRHPLAIYCVDADIDAQDQSGLLSDVGVLPAGKTLTLDSSPRLGVETPGQWRLESLTFRLLRHPSTAKR